MEIVRSLVHGCWRAECLNWALLSMKKITWAICQDYMLAAKEERMEEVRLGRWVSQGIIGHSANRWVQAGDNTLVALAKHSRMSLEVLDMSWCRSVTDHGLGFVADSCPLLRELRLFGCTQVCHFCLFVYLILSWCELMKVMSGMLIKWTMVNVYLFCVLLSLESGDHFWTEGGACWPCNRFCHRLFFHKKKAPHR
jgi:hypothetical protein